MTETETKPRGRPRKTAITDPEIIGMVGELAAAKLAEGQARDTRVALEERLIEALKFAKAEGSSTYRFPDEVGSVLCTANVSRTLDVDAYRAVETEVAAALPDEKRPVVYAPKIDTRRLKGLRESHPNLWRRVAACITTKPGKVSVAIKGGKS